MPVDVQSEVVVYRPRGEVAAWAGDPTNAPLWQANLSTVEWIGRPELAERSRVAVNGRLLGRELNYTYVVQEYTPGQRLVMTTVDGTFAVETTYEWTDENPGTRMVMRLRGTPSGFGVVAPLVQSALQRACTRDLRRLKELLEAGAV